MMSKKKLHLFEGFGVELEYMIVDRDTLNVKPMVDTLIHAVAGRYIDEVEQGDIAWSNELVLHVLELKTNGPRATLPGLSTRFHKNILKINQILADHHACLLPTGAHPWMDPDREMILWPHGHSEIYESFHRIFNCRGHGWANLQSAHLNLPFGNDEEFARLHNAIRLLLPIIPALCASTPLLNGKKTGSIDSRLTFYGKNQVKIPSITGKIIPEAVSSQREYEEVILEPMYSDIDPHDPDKVLQYEWLNSRGAIARFDRSAIEIRVIDIQESPMMDLSLIQLLVSVLHCLTEETWCSSLEQSRLSEDQLLSLFLKTVEEGSSSLIEDHAYLQQFGLNKNKLTARELWQHLFEAALSRHDLDQDAQTWIKQLLIKGNLSERILAALGANPTEAHMKKIYEQLARCLADNSFFPGQ